MTRIQAALLVVLCAFVSPAAAACLTSQCGPDDAAAVEAMRAAIQRDCDCAGAASAKAYRSCVKEMLGVAVLSKACAKAVKLCETASTCGRPDAVVCCERRGTGAMKATVKRSASRCQRGVVCDHFAHAADACDASTDDGCAAEPTTTSTSTTTLPPTTTTSTIPSCVGGAPNGTREAGEQCDGGLLCTSTCRLNTVSPGCCQGTGQCMNGPGSSLSNLRAVCSLIPGSTPLQAMVCGTSGQCVTANTAPAPYCCQMAGSCWEQTIIGSDALWAYTRDCSVLGTGSPRIPAHCVSGTCVME